MYRVSQKKVSFKVCIISWPPRDLEVLSWTFFNSPIRVDYKNIHFVIIWWYFDIFLADVIFIVEGQSLTVFLISFSFTRFSIFLGSISEPPQNNVVASQLCLIATVSNTAALVSICIWSYPPQISRILYSQCNPSFSYGFSDFL